MLDNPPPSLVNSWPLTSKQEPFFPKGSAKEGDGGLGSAVETGPHELLKGLWCTTRTMCAVLPRHADPGGGGVAGQTQR